MDYATVQNLASDLLSGSNLQYDGTETRHDSEEFRDQDDGLNRPGLWSDSEGGHDDDSQDEQENEAAAIAVERLNDDVRAAGPFRRKSAQKGRRATAQPSDEVCRMLGQVNQDYGEGNHEAAERALHEIIRIDSNVAEAWQLLGEIQKERNNLANCLTAWFTAAELSRVDSNLWRETAELSAELQNIEQADYCFRQYSKLEPNDVNRIWDRAMLNKKHGRTAKAIDACRQLLKVIPYDMLVVKELTHFYDTEGRLDEATKLLEAATDYYVSSNQREEFNWENLSFFADTYTRRAVLEARSELWRELLHKVKMIARWLHHREYETWWDDRQDDAEWDAEDDRRRSEPDYRVDADMQRYSLEPGLRAKLGRARLALKDKAEAMRHFDHIKHNVAVHDAPELYIECGDVLLGAEAWTEALQFYVELSESSEYTSFELLLSMAKAYKADNVYEEAENCLDLILTYQPRNVDAMVMLADLYEQTDRTAQALEMINKIIPIQRQMHDGANQDETVSLGGESAIADSQSKSTRKTTRGTKSRSNKQSVSKRHDELIAYEARKTEETRTKFKAIDLSRNDMLLGDSNSIEQWTSAAADLIDDFRNIRHFYPAEKKDTFRGVIRSRKHKESTAAASSADNLQTIANRLEESMTAVDSVQANVSHLAEFRGFSFDRWLEIFLQYAIILADSNQTFDAFSVLEAAYKANVFYQNHSSFIRIHLTKMLISIRVKDEKIGQEEGRWLMLNCLFRKDALRLYSSVLSAGSTAALFFRDNETKKFMLRLIKTMDGVLSGQNIAHTISMKDLHLKPESVVPKVADPVLLVLYGHMLAGGRSFLPSLQYFTRAYALSPEDPMIIFSIGLAYLHRSMQRQSDNRHMQIIQACSFLLKYHKQRHALKQPEYAQEADYNIGRALHQLGLSHLALKYYEKVLACSNVDPRYDLSCSAAYNMQLIYVLAGNAKMARRISERYLII